MRVRQGRRKLNIGAVRSRQSLIWLQVSPSTMVSVSGGYMDNAWRPFHCSCNCTESRTWTHISLLYRSRQRMAIASSLSSWGVGALPFHAVYHSCGPHTAIICAGSFGSVRTPQSWWIWVSMIIPFVSSFIIKLECHYGTWICEFTTGLHTILLFCRNFEQGCLV